MALLNFDATNVPQAESLEPVPTAWYHAVIDESEIKPTKNQDGAYLECRFKIIAGQYINRKIYTRFNIQNQSAQAQELAFKQLSSLCHATGRVQVADSQEMHGIPVAIHVKLKAASGDYEASNDIRGFKRASEQVDTSSPVAPTPAFLNANPFAPPAQQFMPIAPVAPQMPPQYAPPQMPQAPQAPQAWAQAPQQPWQAAQPAAQQAPQQPQAPAPMQVPQQQFAPPQQAPAQAAAPAGQMPSWMQAPQGDAPPPWAGSAPVAPQ